MFPGLLAMMSIDEKFSLIKSKFLSSVTFIPPILNCVLEAVFVKSSNDKRIKSSRGSSGVYFFSPISESTIDGVSNASELNWQDSSSAPSEQSGTKSQSFVNVKH